ncbi:MAG: helix-turn-helix transcriptional regulator [Ginsengibacter sp.]
MSTKKEKFLKLVSEDTSNTVEWMKERQRNRSLYRFSGKLALAILHRLEQLNWTQTRLAEEMGVTKQQVSKWVKGKENFQIETILKIGEVLKMQLIEVPQSSFGIHSIKETDTLVSPYDESYNIYERTQEIPLNTMLVAEPEENYQVNCTF